MNKPNETLRLVKHFAPVPIIDSEDRATEEIQETLILSDEKKGGEAGEAKEAKKMVVFIHGYNKMGAWECIRGGDKIVSAGYIAALPSQMGFGGSEGKRDYCGPKTVRAIVESIQSIANEHGLSPEDIVVWGVSRGAIITSIIATRYPELAAAYVCQAGAYDFLKNHNHPTRPQDMKGLAVQETGGITEGEAWERIARERSAFFDVEKITKPVLILHGDADDTINVEQAYLFEAALKEAGKTCEFRIIPGGTHHITSQAAPLALDFIKHIFAHEQ